MRKYRLRFEAPVDLIRTGDNDRDIFENTQRFAKVIEDIIRKHPDQWVWVHGALEDAAGRRAEAV